MAQILGETADSQPVADLSPQSAPRTEESRTGLPQGTQSGSAATKRAMATKRHEMAQKDGPLFVTLCASSWQVRIGP